MGCWKETIYGGDIPLKHKEKIYELCKAEEYDSEHKSQPIPLKILNKKLSEIKKMIDGAKGEDSSNIGYLVLGAIMMHAGAEFDELTLSRVNQAADEDDWSKENQLRKTVIKNYKKTLKEYNPSEPIDIDTINVLEDVEDTEEDIIANEFRGLFTIMNARIKKLKRGIEEKSGVVEYDEGFGDASQEEIDFLTDYKEYIERQEQLAVVLERIENRINFSASSAGGVVTSGGGNGSMSGGNDIIAG